MLEDLVEPEGMLHPVLCAVRDDAEHGDGTGRHLALEIRTGYFNVYYRGGNIMRVGGNQPPYSADFDSRYAQRGHGRSKGVLRAPATPWNVPPSPEEGALHASLLGSGLLDPKLLRTPQDVSAHVAQLPARKMAMDANIRQGRGPKAERGAQQAMTATCNADPSSD